MPGVPVVTARFDHTCIEVSPDGDQLVVDDPSVVTAIMALKEACVVTITVTADHQVRKGVVGRTLGDHVKINTGLGTVPTPETGSQ